MASRSAAAVVPKKAPSPTIQVMLYGGDRKLFPAPLEILLRLRDGFQHFVLDKFVKANVINIPVEFHDNLQDQYCITVSAKDYIDVGFFPIYAQRNGTVSIDLMMMRKGADFQFWPWAEIQNNRPFVCDFMALALKPGEAEERYKELQTNRKPTLAALLNLIAAMAQINLAHGTPLSYYRGLIWDQSMAQDRFFGYCDVALIDEVESAMREGLFAVEPGPGIFHRGATRSYKQKQFGEANVQLTFHENDIKNIDGTKCVVLEADIDYFSDFAAHTLLEVIPNTFGDRLTDPKTVYLLRWMAGRHAGVPEFDPPYAIM